MKISKTFVAAAILAMGTVASAHAQMVKYRVDLKSPGQVEFMTVTTMLVGQKGLVAKHDGNDDFTLSVETKSVATDGTVNAMVTYDWKKGDLENKDTIPLNLKPGESKELFNKSGVSASVTLQN